MDSTIAPDGIISCLEFSEVLAAGPHGDPLVRIIANHLDNDHYCEIFGNSEPTDAVLQAWIARRTAASDDVFLNTLTEPDQAALIDGVIGKEDLDCLFHILCEPEYEPDTTPKVDYLPQADLEKIWNAGFGERRAIAKGGRKTATGCPTPPISLPQKTTAPEPAATLVKLQTPKPADVATAAPASFPPVAAKAIEPPPAPAPLFVRDLTRYNTQDGKGLTTQRLRYTISGATIAVEVLAEGKTLAKILDAPALRSAQLPQGEIVSADGSTLRTDGRMVASIPAHAVLKFSGAGPVSYDALKDMVEITWCPVPGSDPDDPYQVQLETFVSPNSPSGHKLENIGARDLDGDGKDETITRYALTDHHLANRSLRDENGRSKHPDGWAQNDGTDADKNNARLRIHHSSVGMPPKP